MSHLEHAVVFGFIGLAVSTLVLVFLWILATAWGREVWRRLRRAYSLTVIVYWLDRLEKHGMREFQTAEAEDLQRKKALATLNEDWK